LWFHVTAAPVQHDPFDVAAFEASFPTPEENKAGRALERVLAKVPERFLPHELWTRAYQAFQENRWPRDDAELNAKLDAYAAEPWFSELRAALTLPLGVIDAGPLSSDSSHIPAQTASTIVRARALQLMARGKPEDALELLSDNLALSRQVRNKAPRLGLAIGLSIEGSTIGCIPAWALSAVSQPDLLKRAISIVRAHDEAVPPLSDTIKRDYMQAISPATRLESLGRYNRQVDGTLETLLFAAPWEQRRRRSILATLCAGYLRTADLPLHVAAPRIRAAQVATGLWNQALSEWTPTSTDPIEAAGEFRRVFRLVDESNWLSGFILETSVFESAIATEVTRRAAILQLALVEYRARHGRSAKALTELVPDIVPALPIDPYSGQSFRFRISAGEEMPWFGNNSDGSQQMLQVAAGQGVIWSVGPDFQDNGGVKPGEAYQRLVREGADIIFLVPFLKKP
jgi:hypothetical protein